MVFGTAHSKGLARHSFVTAHSVRLKVVCFDTLARRFVTADSKGVAQAPLVDMPFKRVSERQ